MVQGKYLSFSTQSYIFTEKNKWINFAFHFDLRGTLKSALCWITTLLHCLYTKHGHISENIINLANRNIIMHLKIARKVQTFGLNMFQWRLLCCCTKRFSDFWGCRWNPQVWPPKWSTRQACISLQSVRPLPVRFKEDVIYLTIFTTTNFKEIELVQPWTGTT